MRSKLCPLLVCLIVSACRTTPVSQPIGQQDEWRKPVGKAVRETMEQYKIPGLSIAVVDHNELVWVQGYGIRDKESGLPVDSETRFQAASISKPLTALVLLQLAAEGKLKLDEDVNTQLTRWRLESPHSQPVTLRQLACHYGGTGPGGFDGFSELEQAPSLLDVMSNPYFRNGPVKVVGEPGLKFQYSGGGYCIIQLAMEEATGKPFEQLMDEMLLKPLNMTRSHFCQPPLESQTDNCAHGYGPTEKLSPKGRWNVYPQKTAAGLWTTPTDLAKLIVAIQAAAAGDESGPIKPEVAREFLKEQFNGRMGFGVFLDGKDDNRGFFHAGQNCGYFSRFGAGISNGRGWVIMTNAEKDMFRPILEVIAAEFGWNRETQ